VKSDRQLFGLLVHCETRSERKLLPALACPGLPVLACLPGLSWPAWRLIGNAVPFLIQFSASIFLNIIRITELSACIIGMTAPSACIIDLMTSEAGNRSLFPEL
tara:strand:- start:17 stop:328 length:312 start_codon:yes stop_codon:yes gene_type:complete